MKTIAKWVSAALLWSLVGCSGSGGDTNSSNHSYNDNSNDNGSTNDNGNANDNGNTNNNNNNQDPHCGNGIVEGIEACDDGLQNSDTAPDACRSDCTLARCGDAVADTGEGCDGADLAQQTCSDISPFNHGTLSCASGCTLDTSQCYQCGNSTIEPGEDCEGGNLAGGTCSSVAGLSDGTLACTGACAYDTAGCWECGNGAIEASEVCDQGAGNCNDSAACTCATNCTLPGCGNGAVEPYLGEQCDEGAGNCNGGGCTCSTTCTAPGDPCGYPLDGVWFEIDYTSAYTATNPDWTFSATPGWGEPQWAPNGSSWPEVWDVYNNISVGSDPIGYTIAHLGPSSTLQVMLGLAGLTSYTYASVCVEGRSVSATSSVIFDVYNPLNGCGASATMAHDWTVHAVGVNLANCFISNNDFQALRIEPSGGSSSLGIMRVRLILHGAVY
ncbi:MAG: hypothetical protein ABI333_30615 [bacterium]